MEPIQEEGIVVEIAGRVATVQVKKAGACAHCKAGCMEHGGYMLAEAENSIGAQVGDTVRLHFNPRAALTAVLVVFGIPLLALLLGAVLTSGVAGRIGYQGNIELLESIGVGAVMFLLAFIPIPIYDRHIKKSGVYNVAVAQIVKKGVS